MTQPRAFGAFTGTEYGSFDRGGHPVDKLTQAGAFGAFTRRRYGSFARTPPAERAITQLRAFGAFSGQRYHAFSGRMPYVNTPDISTSGSSGYRPKRLPLPESVLERILQDDEEVILLTVAAAWSSGLFD